MSVCPPLCTAGYNRLSLVAHHFLTARLLRLPTLQESEDTSSFVGGPRFQHFLPQRLPWCCCVISGYYHHLPLFHKSLPLSCETHEHNMRPPQWVQPAAHTTSPPQLLKGNKHPLTHPEQGFQSLLISSTKYGPTFLQSYFFTPTPCFGQCAV